MLSMVDANTKRMKLPLRDKPDESRYSLFHGAKARIKMDRAFGCLTYFALEHEFNATAQTNHTIVIGGDCMSAGAATDLCGIAGSLHITTTLPGTICLDR